MTNNMRRKGSNLKLGSNCQSVEDHSVPLSSCHIGSHRSMQQGTRTAVSPYYIGKTMWKTYVRFIIVGTASRGVTSVSAEPAACKHKNVGNFFKKTFY